MSIRRFPTSPGAAPGPRFAGKPKGIFRADAAWNAVTCTMALMSWIPDFHILFRMVSALEMIRSNAKE